MPDPVSLLLISLAILAIIAALVLITLGSSYLIERRNAIRQHARHLREKHEAESDALRRATFQPRHSSEVVGGLTDTAQIDPRYFRGQAPVNPLNQRHDWNWT